MEAMQQETERLGFDSETARQLVQQAASGACALVEANPHVPLSALREQVTSKGEPLPRQSACSMNSTYPKWLPMPCEPLLLAQKRWKTVLISGESYKTDTALGTFSLNRGR